MAQTQSAPHAYWQEPRFVAAVSARAKQRSMILYAGSFSFGNYLPYVVLVPWTVNRRVDELLQADRQLLRTPPSCKPYGDLGDPGISPHWPPITTTHQ